MKQLTFPLWKWVLITSGILLTFVSVFLPIWEGFDEPAHYCYVQHLVEHKEIPNPPGEGQTDYCSSQVEESFAQLPLNKSLSLSPQLIGFGFADYAAYWKAKADTAPEEITGEKEARQSTTSMLDIWQAQHPPFPYLILAIPYLIALPAGFYTQVLVLRLVCAAITLLGIWVSWKALERLNVNTSARLFGFIAVVLAPMFFIHFGRISNEPVTFLLFSVVWYFLLGVLNKQPLKKWELLLCGLVYGLGFVSKIFFASALPAVLVIFGLDVLAQKNRIDRISSLTRLGLFLAGLMVFALPWLAYQHFGPVTAGVGFSAQSPLGLQSMLSSFTSMDWFGFFREIFLNYSGLFGWSFLRTAPWFYAFQVAFWIITLFGCIRLRGTPLKIAICSLLFPLCLLAGMTYYNLQFQALTITGGWYFYSMGAMLATFLALCWNRLIQDRWLLPLALLLAWANSLYLLWMVFKLMMPVFYAI